MDSLYALYGKDRSSPVGTEVFVGDQELVSEPKYVSMDDQTTAIVLPDDEAEIIVTAIGYSASGAGKFFLHNGDNIPITQTFNFAANDKDTLVVWLPMGSGNPCCLNASPTSGKLTVYVEYSIRRTGNRQNAKDYLP